MRIWSLGRLISPAVAALILAFGLLVVPAVAQNGSSGSNPTAQAVNEQQLLDELNKVQGRITIPDRKAATLQQPQGRDYQGFHERALPWIGAIAIIGMLLVLALFYLFRGRIRTLAGESGIRILRFNALERLAHWTTATAFIILAITGLNFVFGKRLLMPLIGPEAFSTWSIWAKYAHDFVAWAFMLGVLVMLVLWVWDNFPDRYDANWLKSAGGMFDKSNRTHPPAGRFNTGQKLIFWAVVLGGIALSASGIFMLFPFAFTDINGMQTAQYIHAIVGVLLIAVMIAHIYIGTLGMEGAYEAMGSGTVDLNWAKEHHSVWVDEQQAKTKGGVPPHTAPTPAE
ncbi:formate dehydrogenase subunit gamma [Pseudaminobacter sp. 19-2017]|uniref:Formate dehydrogenase subunit gamma n=1 Tax=Pseudaminobacter soli (ex Zhang et al. 2022) TaxID=2831468 RepID=A0A942I2P4_9HYPH|nr:formate dehydrogenase subunit gamma [Pseudaminobacter soli]MBS3650012.1 formate dehydrogenase subunit gamma [Pseudaminobacter soli]